MTSRPGGNTEDRCRRVQGWVPVVNRLKLCVFLPCSAMSRTRAPHPWAFAGERDSRRRCPANSPFGAGWDRCLAPDRKPQTPNAKSPMT
jgi:hypothetical protein